MSPRALQLRRRLGALLLSPMLASWGCEMEHHEQRLVCYSPASGEVCSAREQASSKLPSSVDGCKGADDLVSVDDGPVERPVANANRSDCCYLVTYTIPVLGLCASGRPLFGPEGPRLATLRPDRRWG